MTADELYQALYTLQVGEIVPDDVYMLDYADGQSPRWTVATREELGAGGAKLVLHDKQNADLFNCVQLIVLTFPGKTLRTVPHLDDSDELPGKLCDLAQQGRYAEKRGWRSQTAVQLELAL